MFIIKYSARIALLLSMFLPLTVQAYSGNSSAWPTAYDNGPSYNATTPGSPYPGSDCSSCHGTGGGYTGSTSVSGDTTPAPGQVTNYTFSYSSNAVKNGFSLSVKNSQGSRVGSFSNPGTDVKIHDIADNLTTTSNHITHDIPKDNPSPGSNYNSSWTFSWTAPTGASVIGDVYHMYSCLNQVNGDGVEATYLATPPYTVTYLDGPPVCSIKTITITNTPPQANPDTASVSEDGPAISFNVKTNDNDGDAGAAQTLTVTAVNQPTTAPNGTTSESGTTDGLVTYNPNGQFESLAFGESTTDVFTYSLSDGYPSDIRTGTVTVTINGANDAPTVSVVNGSGSYVEGSAPTTVISSATVSDVDTTDLISGATVQITNYVSGQDSLACGTVVSGITCSFSAGTLTLSGTKGKGIYRTALQGVTYSNSSANPTTGVRTIAFKVIDDSGQSNNTSAASNNATVTVSAVSTPPVITGFSGTASFTEGTAVVVDSTSTLSDPDSTLLTQAVMTLTTNYTAQDVLVCPGSLPSGITCGYSAPALTLSSAGSSFSSFQTAIHAVQFNNTSQDPGTLNRTVTLIVRDESSTPSSAASKTISITPVNDPPSFTTVPDMTAVEDATNSISYQVNETDPDDSGAGLTYSLIGQPSGMSISTSGLITWTPPRTNVFDKAYSGIQVKVADGGENGATPATQTFTVTVSPPDFDSDRVADYADNCPSVKNGAAEDNQADLDGDTQYMANAGFPAIGDVDPTAKDANGFLTGGDACDEDIDGDGIPNSIEDDPRFPFLNSRNPADAALDQDGDGLTNLQEYRNDTTGNTINVDSVGPVVIAPVAVTVNSTGYLTNVDLGFASAIDGNDGSINIIVPIIDATIGLCSDLSNYPLTVPPFRPGSYQVDWTTCDKSGNPSSATQNVRVRPILSTTPGQIVGAGQTAVVRFMLNGQAADYPVTAKYTVSGTANSSDYSLGSSTLTISQTDVEGTNPGLVGKLSLTTAGSISQDENVTITLSNVSNAVLGATKTHVISIVNHDTTPVLSTAVTQNSVATGRTVYVGAGTVVLTVNTSDTNSATAPVFDWSMTDNAIFAIGSGSIVNAAVSSSMSFDPSSLAAGLYPVVVTVTDAGLTSTARFTLNVAASAPDVADCNLDGVADTNTDCDGDGALNTTEGAVDSNGNGIPDYLDDSRIVDRNVLQNQTGDPANTYLLATDPGLQLRLGATALASGASGALVSQQNINDHGGQNGGAGMNSQDSDSNDGGFYDFEVTGLNDMITSARVVIPLQSAILDNAVYRKYNGSAWSSFVVDANNAISSAPGNDGVCPAPGSIEYTPGLTPLNACVELLIEDGGPNDVDGARDYVIRDPGGVAIPPAEATPAPDKTKGGAGIMHPAVLLLMLAIFSLLAPRRKVRSQAHKAK